MGSVCRLNNDLQAQNFNKSCLINALAALVKAC
jgi:hypothetical protein